MFDSTKELRIADVIGESIVDGPGYRMTVFTQGCPHHCEGCHNPHTHSFDGGRGEAEEREAGKQNGHSVMTYRAEPTQKKMPLNKKLEEGERRLQG